jgi:hemerythrin-like domain-containing protein
MASVATVELLHRALASTIGQKPATHHPEPRGSGIPGASRPSFRAAAIVPRGRNNSMKLATVCGVVLIVMGGAPALRGEETRPTAAFREEHAVVKAHLEHLSGMAGALPSAAPAEQRKNAAFVARFLTDHIVPHAKWEEERLYPAVDRRTHGGEHAFTSTMRYEHRVVGRWIEELTALANAPALDAGAFARKTDRLLGLISAHFEEEEEVLLPILDRGTTREVLEAELGMAKPH